MRVAPAAANFLWLDLGRSNRPVHEALLAGGLITKPWRDRGCERRLRVSIGTPEQNAAFVDVLAAILGAA